MNQTASNISSAIMRSTHILLVRIEAVTFNEWKQEQAGGVSRLVDLDLNLQEVLKGKTDEQDNARIAVRIMQWGTGTTRIAGVPGAWSYQTLEVGDEYIVFCRAADNRVTEMLTDPFCHLVLTAKESLADVRMALDMDIPVMGARHLAMPVAGEDSDTEARVKLFKDIMSKALVSADTLGIVWAEHLWAMFSEIIVDYDECFELLIHAIEQPDLAYPARATLLSAVYSQLIAMRAQLEKRCNQLAQCLFRLLDCSTASALHDNIISVYLPNLLGLSEGLTAKIPGKVFGENKDLMEKAEQILLAYKGFNTTVELLNWIRGT